jgi:uncharacterized protein (TIGR04255 family)
VLVATEKKVDAELDERIPKRITPDSLLDTFVQVHYILKIDKGRLLDSIKNILEPDFTPVGLDDEARKKAGVIDDEVLFSGQGIIFRIREKLVSFTCSEGYIGWKRYSPLIRKVLQKMCDADWINVFPRVSIRYINSLPWAPLSR